MATVAPAIDFTARTFDALRERARELLRQRVQAFRYNSFVATDVAPAILDVLAWYQEQNAFYYDRRFRNSLLILADTREAMSVLAQAQGYRMRPATSASVAVQATPTPPQGAAITLRRGTRINVRDLVFEVAADTVIPPGVAAWPDGTTDDIIALTEGASRVETFQSDGSEFQAFELGQPGAIDGSVAVTVVGEEWQEVASLVFIEGDQRGRDTFTGDGTNFQLYDLSLLNAIVGLEDEDGVVVLVTPVGQPATAAQRWQQVDVLTNAPREFRVSQTVDGVTTIHFGQAIDGAAPGVGDQVDIIYVITGSQKRYQLTYDPDDRATIRFGDGLFGVIPAAGATIEVTYRTGGGPRGNVPVGALNGSVQGYLPSGARAAVSLANLEAGSGGESAETVDHARFFAPRVAKSNGRAVTREDWTALAATYVDPIYGAPAHASARLKQRRPELNTVQVAVWGRDDSGRIAAASSALKQAIKKFLDTKRTITTVAEMVDGQIILLDFALDVELTLGAIRQVVFAAITAALEQHFRSAFILPGVDVSISRLYDVIQSVEGVERAEIISVVATQRFTLSIGTGDGVTKQFNGNFAVGEGLNLVPESLVVTASTQQAVDNGAGSFTGDVDVGVFPGPGNQVDYDTGEFQVTLNEAPGTGVAVLAEVKATVFFAAEDDLGASDGTVTSLLSGTRYYPIVRRAARGLWSGDQRKCIDAFQVSTTARMRGRLPRGIIPASITITDSTGAPQTGTDNGVGVIVGPGIATGSVDYTTGDIDFEFNVPPTLPVFVAWTTRTIDVFMPEEYLPLTPGRVFVWGGFSVDGLQPGVELFAVDDGEGNIFGDVQVGGTIDYETGRIIATWNTDPPPGPGGGAAFPAVPLAPAPDGVTRQFTFAIGADISRLGADGEGRARFVFSSLSRPGVTFEDAYDNWQGRLDGASLDPEGLNTISYGTGIGTITFRVPPAASAPAVFPVEITNVGTFMYAGWVYRVKTPGSPGLDKGLFADNNGRLWGPPGAGSANPFPADRLEHERGQFVATLQGAAVAAGRPQFLTYDSLTGVPPALDIPIAGDEVATAGRITLREQPPEMLNT